jgi:hypothetical protein
MDNFSLIVTSKQDTDLQRLGLSRVRISFDEDYSIEWDFIGSFTQNRNGYLNIGIMANSLQEAYSKFKKIYTTYRTTGF